MTQRTAHLDLDWEKNGDDYVAQLPAIPGYQGSYPNEVRVASRPKDDDVWLFEMLIGVGDKQVPLYNYDFGIPYGGSADEMMDAVENLDPQDIADVLGDFGFAPDEDTTASRHASRRKADMNLDWIDDGDDAYFAELPPIPGYTEDSPDSVAPDGVATVCVYQTPVATSPDDYWTADIRIDDLDNIGVDLYFPLGLKETAEEMMAAIENLTPEDIARMLDDDDYKLDPRW